MKFPLFALNAENYVKKTISLPNITLAEMGTLVRKSELSHKIM